MLMKDKNVNNNCGNLLTIKKINYNKKYIPLRSTTVYKVNNSKFLIKNGSALFSDKPKKYVIKIFKGNNSNVVKEVINRRNNTIIKEAYNIIDINFIWSQTGKGLDINYINSHNIVYNHIINNKQLASKSKLYKNISNYCLKNNLKITKIMPYSIIFNTKSLNLETELLEFSKIFMKLYYINKGFRDNSKINDKLSDFSYNFNLKNIFNIINFKQRSKNINLNSFKVGLKFGNSFNKGNNLWIFKPCGFNRGIGIEVFSSLNELKNIIHNFFSNKSNNNITKFIIQKYIEDPLLIYGRKFDIRVWVLITQNLEIYIYNNGYIRTSSELFNLEDPNKHIHLTNDFIQKDNKNYGKFENGNKLSFKEFEYYIQSNMNPNYNFNDNTFSDIKSKIILSIKSVKSRFIKRNNLFEIFGYDFMLDNNFNSYLIEVNSNPCYKNKCGILRNYVPNMLNDAFRLTVDKILKLDISKDYNYQLGNVLYNNHGVVERRKNSNSRNLTNNYNNFKLLYKI